MFAAFESETDGMGATGRSQLSLALPFAALAPTWGCQMEATCMVQPYPPGRPLLPLSHHTHTPQNSLQRPQQSLNTQPWLLFLQQHVLGALKLPAQVPQCKMQLISGQVGKQNWLLDQHGEVA